MRAARRFGAACLLALAAAAHVRAQQSDALPVGFTGVQADLVRASVLQGIAPAPFSALVRHSETGTARRGLGLRGRDWSLDVLPVELRSHDNSGWADDRDNGLEWSGRGTSGLARVGVAARWRWFSAAVQPEVAWWENEPYLTLRPVDLARDSMGHPFYRLDMPQRLGTGSGSTASMGQSYVRVDVGPAAIGFSNENIVSGPAIRYPVIFGYSAPGFPHAFFGTGRALDVWIATVQARALVGWTEESDYYDFVEANDFSNLFAWALAVKPRGMEWLEMGVQRTLHYEVEEQFDFDAERLFGFLQPSEAHRVGDELAGIYFRAVLPANEVEFYGEWARTDRFATWTEDFIPEVDHSQGYLLGAQKLVRVGQRARLRLVAETVDLQEQAELRAGAGRPLPVFYNNSQQGRGHTHRGQILGASIGPGADAQFFAADYIDARGFLVGGFVERVRRHDGNARKVGVHYEERESYPFRHDVELIGGMRGSYSYGDLSVDALVSYATRYHRIYITPEDNNVYLSIGLGWWPGRGAAPDAND